MIPRVATPLLGMNMSMASVMQTPHWADVSSSNRIQHGWKFMIASAMAIGATEATHEGKHVLFKQIGGVRLQAHSYDKHFVSLPYTCKLRIYHDSHLNDGYTKRSVSSPRHSQCTFVVGLTSLCAP